FPRPDLVVAVFAPEDPSSIENPVSAPPEARLLCLSRLPRTNAGRIEAYVARVTRQQLSKYGIPELGNVPGEQESTSDNYRSVVAAAQDRQANIRKAVLPLFKAHV